MRQVSRLNFAESFGTSADEFSERALRLMAESDFSYSVEEGAARDAIILDVVRRMDVDTQRIATGGRKDIWFAGWAEALDAYRKNNDDSALIPRFIRRGQAVRLNGEYVMPASPTFELDYMTVFRIWLFEKYLSRCSSIYEFGCGTGLNLVLCRDLFPDAELHGLDFVQSAVDLVNEVGSRDGRRMTGHLFDMSEPDRTLVMANGCGVLSFGAIEQLAGRFEPLLDYLLESSPSICVHVEPTIEMYDEDTLFDYLAARFHRQRGYTQGLLPYLERWEHEGRIRILKKKRLYFGSLMMEGYTYFVWEPI